MSDIDFHETLLKDLAERQSQVACICGRGCLSFAALPLSGWLTRDTLETSPPRPELDLNRNQTRSLNEKLAPESGNKRKFEL
jgi:hypothetical protein